MESYCYPRSFRKMPHRRTTDTELSPTLFNIFLERIMTDALEDHEGTVGIGGRTITNLPFADDIDSLAGEGEELANLVERLDKAFTAYGMEIRAETTKLREFFKTTVGVRHLTHSVQLVDHRTPISTVQGPYTSYDLPTPI